MKILFRVSRLLKLIPMNSPWVGVGDQSEIGAAVVASSTIDDGSARGSYFLCSPLKCKGIFKALQSECEQNKLLRVWFYFSLLPFNIEYTTGVEPRNPITVYRKQLQKYQTHDIKVQVVSSENQGDVCVFLQGLCSDSFAILLTPTSIFLSWDVLFFKVSFVTYLVRILKIVIIKLVAAVPIFYHAPSLSRSGTRKSYDSTQLIVVQTIEEVLLAIVSWCFGFNPPIIFGYNVPPLQTTKLYLFNTKSSLGSSLGPPSMRGQTTDPPFFLVLSVLITSLRYIRYYYPRIIYTTVRISISYFYIDLHSSELIMAVEHSVSSILDVTATALIGPLSYTVAVTNATKTMVGLSNFIVIQFDQTPSHDAIWKRARTSVYRLRVLWAGRLFNYFYWFAALSPILRRTAAVKHVSTLGSSLKYTRSIFVIDLQFLLPFPYRAMFHAQDDTLPLALILWDGVLLARNAKFTYMMLQIVSLQVAQCSQIAEEAVDALLVLAEVKQCCENAESLIGLIQRRPHLAIDSVRADTFSALLASASNFSSAPLQLNSQSLRH